MTAKLRPDKGTVAEIIPKKYFPCTCGEIYLSRKLTASDCPYHAFDWESAMDEYASSPKISGDEGQEPAQEVNRLIDYYEDLMVNYKSSQDIELFTRYWIKEHPLQPTHPQWEQGFAWFEVPCSERLPECIEGDTVSDTVCVIYANGTIGKDWYDYYLNQWVNSPFPNLTDVISWLERRPLHALPANHDVGLDAKDANR